MKVNRKTDEKVNWQIRPINEQLMRDFRIACFTQGKAMRRVVITLVGNFNLHFKTQQVKVGKAEEMGYVPHTGGSILNVKDVPIKKRDHFCWLCNIVLEQRVYCVLADLLASFVEETHNG